MSQSIARALVFVLVLGIGSVAPSLAQVGSLDRSQQKGSDVTERLREAAAEGNAETFAQALVGTGIRASMILRSEEATIRRDSARPADGNPLQIFVARYPEFRRVERNGVTALETTSQTQCVAAARAPVLQFSFSGSVYAALFQLVRHVNRDSREMLPPGYIGEDDAYRTSVNLSVLNTTFAETLDEIVAQAPGVGWAIKDSPSRPDTAARVCLVELFTSTSWLRTSWDVRPRRQ